MPGYYSVNREGIIACEAANVGYYSLGGYGAQQIKCPPHTSTASTNAQSLADCLCEPGYEPASPETLADYNSAANSFKNWILLIPAFRTLNDSQVCVPCGRRRYKEKVSADSCTPCPPHTFAAISAPTARKSCNLCDAGYYLIGNEETPCVECLANHFCVGSDPAVRTLIQFAGAASPCSENTITVEPNYENTQPFKCM